MAKGARKARAAARAATRAAAKAVGATAGRVAIRAEGMRAAKAAVQLVEAVKAVVQPIDGLMGDETLTEELLSYLAEHLSRQKIPRSIDYDAALPRLPTGKLYKRLLRDRYWGEGRSKIV